LNPVSLLELSVHVRLIPVLDTAVATRLDGATGVAPPIGVGVAVAVDVAVGVGVGGGVGVGAGVAVGVGVGVWVGVAVGVGVGVVLLIWTIFATEGTPLDFRMNSM
jgi:hypothetical protein